MNKKFLIIAAFVALIVSQAFGQEDTNNATQTLSKDDPHYDPTLDLWVYHAEPPEKFKNYAITFLDYGTLFTGGLRLGFDMRLQDKNWIQIMPTAYLFPGINSYYEDNDYYYHDDRYYGWGDYYMTSAPGFGIGANYKRFLNKKEFFYCHGGIDYSFRKVDFYSYDFIPYEEDGMTYYRYDKWEQKQNFNKISLTACIGLQSPMKYGFYIDGYLGIGCKYAFYNKNKPALDKGFNDYGYRGLYPVIGFRMGVAFLCNK